MVDHRLSRNVWSYPTLSWITPIIRIGSKKPLEQQDLGLISTSEQSVTVAASFARFWDDFSKHARNPKDYKCPNLSLTLFAIYYPTMLFLAILRLASIIINLGLPYIVLPQVLKFISNPDDPSLLLGSGLAISFAFLAILLVIALLNSTRTSLEVDLAIRVTSLLTGAVYEKALRLSPKSRQIFSEGKILTMINVDVRSLSVFLSVTINQMWSVPLHIVISMYLLSQLIGRAVWSAAGIYILFTLFQMGLGGAMSKAVNGYLKTFDHRITISREFLGGIRVIKYGALEEIFRQHIRYWRDLQTKSLQLFSVSIIFITSLLQIQEVFVPGVAFAVYATLGGDMHSYVPFSALGIFNMLLKPMNEVTLIFAAAAQAGVSYQRMAPYLISSEVLESEVSQVHKSQPENSTTAIKLEAAEFIWESARESNQSAKNKNNSKKFKMLLKKSSLNLDNSTVSLIDKPFRIHSTTLDIPQKCLVAVVGAVGSGKSSMLSALISDMCKVSGQANIYGSISYCSQEPWIITGTIEDNILFNKESARANIPMALSASCLELDLKGMEFGLGTQIGEKGINLSGGQRARIALARAIAHDADIYLLDDPLAALDAHVGKKVFDNAICGVLKNKTVVLVTHQLHLLPKMDMIVVMDKGSVVETGTYSDLIASPSSHLSHIMSNHHVDTSDLDNETDIVVEEMAETKTAMTEKQDSPSQEERIVGRIKLSTLKSYMNFCGGIPYVASLSIVVLIATISVICTHLALGWWAEDTLGLSSQEYIRMYILLGSLSALSSIAMTTLVLLAGKRASVFIHHTALDGLMRTTMGFFDTQPIGRILNRLSGDIELIDLKMPEALLAAVNFMIYVIAGVIVIATSSFILLAQFACLAVLVVILFRFFQSSYRELQRLVAIMRSPLNAHISETLTGIATIQAYCMQDSFIHQQRLNMDQCSVSNMYFEGARNWLALCLELLAASVTFVLVLLATLRVGGSTSTTLGVSLVASMGLSDSLNMLMTAWGKTEAMFNAVERLDHYSYELKSEAEGTLPTDPKPKTWPTKGAIEIKKLRLAYESRPDHPVIKEISLFLKPGEKVGVVGRTGSGKSTLMASLFRIIEAQSGSIEIDGIDISTLGLKTLRSSLQIIPQEPILFSGTFRSNLDVRSEYTDEEIWRALETVGLNTYISSLTNKLDSTISENGTNLSAGQRQLICLCKAILANPKVLVMDEATAAVDASTDRRIQDLIQTHFSDTTVFSVAHRLNTIAAFDRVLVLDQGTVAEFDAPHVLLQNKDSVFSDLVEATGIANATVIRSMALEHFKASNM
ncbi:hypothetical protein O5D80_001098 [Batrachochytrium dendrobatidis]|nr:hypothetical protein O5D80_001098 [Batrachochytrium dendrobatidis]